MAFVWSAPHQPDEETPMPVSPAIRYFIGAVIVAVVGWLVDAYLPLQPIAHIVAIICWIAAVIMVLLGVFALFNRNGPVV